MENLHNSRQVYEKYELLEENIKENPIEQFRDWFYDAKAEPLVNEANAMSISTIEPDGCPRTRMVLLKSYTHEGFIFYTNYNSKKGNALAENPLACLHFFWAGLERQVIIKAKLEKLHQNLSDGYFTERPRGSQIGAWVSKQSSVIPNKAFLESELKILEQQFEGKEIPRPEYWGGYLARPYEIEFWQGRPNRLHDRILYTLQENYDWKIERLSP